MAGFSIEISYPEKTVLIQAADRYIATLNQIGRPETGCSSQEMASLCSKGCKKVRNGKVLFEGREFFAEQLDAGKEWLGAWSIDVEEVFIATETRTAVIRYELATEKEGDLVVIAILRFDANDLIYEINEVHNKRET